MAETIKEMKPSDAEDDAVNDTPAVVVRAPDQIWLCVGDMYDCRGCEVEFDDIKSSFEVSWCEEQMDESDVKYVRADLYEKLEAELQRRQQPASVPAELVNRVHKAMIADGISSTDMFQKMANYFAAYGREQAQIEAVYHSLGLETICPMQTFKDWYAKQYAKGAAKC